MTNRRKIQHFILVGGFTVAFNILLFIGAFFSVYSRILYPLQFGVLFIKSEIESKKIKIQSIIESLKESTRLKEKLLELQVENIKLREKLTNPTNNTLSTLNNKKVIPVKIVAINYPQQGLIIGLVDQTYSELLKETFQDNTTLRYVITKDGIFVGKVKTVISPWIIIETLYTNGFEVPVVIPSTKEVGILKKTPAGLIVDEITKTEKLKLKEIVKVIDPNGLSNLIPVGIIENIEPKHASNSVKLKITPTWQITKTEDNIFVIIR